MTGEVERAKAFFTALFDWSYGEMEGGSLIRLGGKQAGALMDLAVCTPGASAGIGPMVKVEDVDATVERVRALGGEAGAPFDVLDKGRMSTFTDPNGAELAVWQPRTNHGIDADSHAHGAPGWFETLTTDPERAAKFYAALFGWTAEKQSPVPGMTYTVFHLDGVPIAGAMKLIPKQMGAAAPHWATTFTVRNADDTVRHAVELGAGVCIPVSDLAGVGRFALLKSPQGVSFHIAEWAAPPA